MRGVAFDTKACTDDYHARMPDVAQLFAPVETGEREKPGSQPFCYKTDNFHNIIAKVPFDWNYLGEKYDMQLLAGFCGVSYDPKSEVLRAEIAWGVKDPKAPALDDPVSGEFYKEKDQNLSPRESSSK